MARQSTKNLYNARMTRFLLVRHGQTSWNVERRLQGATDIQLSPVGQTQAVKLAERLKSETIHKMYSSPLSRAHETAKAIAAHHPHLSIELEPALAELGMGFMEGKIIEDIHAEYGEAFWTDDVERARLGLDLIAPVVTSLRSWISELSQTHEDKTVLFSSHGGKLMRMLDAFELSPAERKRIKNKHLGNCTLTIVESEGGFHRLALYASGTHL